MHTEKTIQRRKKGNARMAKTFGSSFSQEHERNILRLTLRKSQRKVVERCIHIRQSKCEGNGREKRAAKANKQWDILGETGRKKGLWSVSNVKRKKART